MARAPYFSAIAVMVWTVTALSVTKCVEMSIESQTAARPHTGKE